MSRARPASARSPCRGRCASPNASRQDLRRQIQAAVDELGYVPDPNARALASARADVFGVLVPSLTNNVFAEVVRGIYDSLSDSPFRVQLGNTHYSGLEEERLLQVFLSQRPAALIVAGIDQTPTSRKLLESAGCPVVQIMETGPDPVDMMVGFSHFDGGRDSDRASDRGGLPADRLHRRAHGSALAAAPCRLSRGDGEGRPVRPAAGHHHAAAVQRDARPRAASRCAGQDAGARRRLLQQ